MRPRKGDVLFVWGGGPISKAIEEITDGPSHCAIFIDRDTVAEANIGRTAGEKPFKDYLKDKHNHLEIWRDCSLTEKEISHMVFFAKRHFHLPYDYATIIAEFVRFELDVNIDDWKEGKSRICSTFVNDCARSIRHQWTDEKLPAPVDLLNGGILKRKGVRKACRKNTLMSNVLRGLKQGWKQLKQRYCEWKQNSTSGK